jgi:hypothetical protein
MAASGTELRCGLLQKGAHLILVNIDAVAWLVCCFGMDPEILSSNLLCGKAPEKWLRLMGTSAPAHTYLFQKTLKKYRHNK